MVWIPPPSNTLSGGFVRCCTGTAMSATRGDAKVVQGGLRLDRRHLLLAEGDSGPPVTPGHPGERPLVASLMHAGDGLDMPPQGRLPQADIELIVDWVARGAPMPADGAADTARTQPDIESSRGFWSFLPLASPPRRWRWPRSRRI